MANFRVKSNRKAYKNRFAIKANTTKKINKTYKAQRGGIKL